MSYQILLQIQWTRKAVVDSTTALCSGESTGEGGWIDREQRQEEGGGGAVSQ